MQLLREINNTERLLDTGPTENKEFLIEISEPENVAPLWIFLDKVEALKLRDELNEFIT